MAKPDHLADVLKRKFGDVRGAGDWLRIPCPTCTVHNRKKLKRHVPRHGYSSNCFICGIRLDVREMLEGMSYIPSITHEDHDDEVPAFVDPRALKLPYAVGIPVNKLPPGHPAIKFLHKDCLYDLDRYANENKMVYVPFEGGDIFSNGSVFCTSAEHLVFPVYFKSALVGWQLRSVPGTFYGDQPKDVCIRYFHLFNKGSYLYNYDNAKANNPKRVIVVEGVKKALKFPNAVATWGTGISRKQLKLIQEWKEVIIMLDAEEANKTQKKAREIVEGLNSGSACKAINIDLSKYGVNSPDDLPGEILQLIAEEEWNAQTKT